MDIKSVLTEAEYTGIPEAVLAKLENAYRTELAAAVERENTKSSAKFQKLLESVGAKADAMIAKAVDENVSRMNSNAMSDKMFGVLKNIATILEGAGIPTSEDTKRLREELAKCNVNLKKAYQEREHVVAELNEQNKKNFIYRQVQGMRPEIVDKVMQQFIHSDIREITREAIAKFIDGTSTEMYMMDTDPEAQGELNMDRVNAALNDIDHELELDTPTFPSAQRAKNAQRYETLGKGLKNERVAKATPNVTFEALNGMSSMNPMFEDTSDFAENNDEDVAAAINQCNAFGRFGSFV